MVCIVYQLLITTCETNEQIYGDARETERAIAFFNNMKEQGLVLDIFTINAMMRAVVKDRQHAEKVAEVRVALTMTIYAAVAEPR